MLKKIFQTINIFESNLSAAEWAGRIVTFLFIGGGGTLSAKLAEEAPLLAGLGDWVWVAVGVPTALLIALMLFLTRYGYEKLKYAEYLAAMSQPSGQINPLDETFDRVPIKIPDLALPGTQVHEHKRFSGCSFIGPGALVLAGRGTVDGCRFRATSFVALPHITFDLSGLTVLNHCTILRCEFHNMTIFLDRSHAQVLADSGVLVAGYPSVPAADSTPSHQSTEDVSESARTAPRAEAAMGTVEGARPQAQSRGGAPVHRKVLTCPNCKRSYCDYVVESDRYHMNVHAHGMPLIEGEDGALWLDCRCKESTKLPEDLANAMKKDKAVMPPADAGGPRGA